MIKTNYNEPSFTEAREHAIQFVLEALEKVDSEVGIACTGISGIVISSIISHITGRKLCVVRKEGYLKNCHSNLCVEGFISGSYVIIDDFSCTGKTFKRIIEQVTLARPDSQCVGSILYSDRVVYPMKTMMDRIATYCP